MRLQTTTLARLTSFMLGAAWALVLVGAFSAFFSFVKINLLFALLSAFLGAMPGLLIVLFLEYLMLKSEKLAEMKEQTKLMQDIVKKLQ